MTAIEATVLKIQQTNARQQVRHALKAGKLKKPAKCPICGSTESKLVFHHTGDYLDQLEGQYVCVRCHFATHKALKNAVLELKRKSKPAVPEKPIKVKTVKNKAWEA